MGFPRAAIARALACARQHQCRHSGCNEARANTVLQRCPLSIVAARTALHRAQQACRFATAPDARPGRLAPSASAARGDAHRGSRTAPSFWPLSPLLAACISLDTSVFRAEPLSMRHPKSQRHAPAPLAATGLASTSAASAQSRCCDRCGVAQSSTVYPRPAQREQRPVAWLTTHLRLRPRPRPSPASCPRPGPPAARCVPPNALTPSPDRRARALSFSRVARPCEHQTR